MSRSMLHYTCRSLAIASFAFAVCGASTSAQDPADTTGGGMGYFQVGYIGLDLGELNGSLTGSGYPAFGESFVTLGGAGYGTRGDLLIGGAGRAVIGGDETTVSGNTQLSIAGGYGLFRLGYRVVSNGGLDVFPTLGIGGGAMEIKIAERSSPTFADILNNPQRSSRVATGMFLLDGAVTALYRITLRESPEGETGGLLIGLEGGYTLAPGSSSWKLDEINSVAGGPALRIEGFHVSLSIGGWGRG